MNLQSLTEKKTYIYRDYFFVAIMIFALFNLIFSINGLWPYGDNVIAFGDSVYQISRLGVHIFDVFDGSSTLFYTNHIANGVEIFSSLEYMLFSPFYLIALPFGRELFIYMLNISVMLMCMFNGLIFLHFIRKYFKNVGELSRVLLSLMFAFGSYLFYAFPFITWLSFPGITILTIDGFLDLVKSKKMFKFIAGTTWLVLTSFYLGVSANIVLVLLFSVYAIFVVNRQERGETLTKLFFSYIISALLCVIILLPAIYGSFQTSRIDKNLQDLFSSTNSMYSYNFQIRLCSLVLDALVFVLGMLYFIFSDKKSREKKFFIFALIILVLPYLANSCLKLLCFGSYVGLPFRLTFLNQVFMFMLAAKFLNSQPLNRLQEHRSNRAFLALSIFLVGLFLLCYCVMVAMYGGSLGNNLKCGIYSNELAIWASTLLASTAIIVGFLIFVGLRKIISKSVIAVISAVLMFISIGLNLSIFASDTGTSNADHKNAIAVLESAEPNILFSSLHTEKVEILTNLANFLTPHNRASSMFSSLTAERLLYSYNALGFTYNQVSIDASANALSESLFGVTYYISSMELDRPYLTKITEQDGTYLYKNELATSGAVVLDDIEFGDDGIANLEAIKNSLKIEGELFKDVDVDGVYLELDKEDARYLTCLKKFTFTATEDCILYMSGDIASMTNFEMEKLFKKDQIALACQYCSEYPRNDVAFVRAGETIEFFVTSSKLKGNELDGLKFMTLNYNTLKKMTDELKNRQAKIEYTKNGYSVSVPQGLSGTLTIFACDIDGMQYTLNGESTPSENIFAYWTSFSVSGGEQIVAEYEHPLKTVWIVLIVLGVALFILIWWLCKRYKFKALQKPIKIAFFALDGIILSVFYLLGLVLSIFV